MGQSNTFNPPLGMDEFSEDLKKESAELYEKFQESKFSKDVFPTEQHFLDELKDRAPILYEKLKKSNFKFKLDEKTRKELASLVSQSQEILSRLNAEKTNDKDNSSKK